MISVALGEFRLPRFVEFDEEINCDCEKCLFIKRSSPTVVKLIIYGVFLPLLWFIVAGYYIFFGLKYSSRVIVSNDHVRNIRKWHSLCYNWISTMAVYSIIVFTLVYSFTGSIANGSVGARAGAGGSVGRGVTVRAGGAADCGTNGSAQN